MEHLTLDELKRREDYYNKYVLSNPLLSIKRRKAFGLIQHYDSLVYNDIRHQNGILLNDGIYVLNDNFDAYERHNKKQNGEE